MDRADDVICIGRHNHTASTRLALYLAVTRDASEREEWFIEGEHVPAFLIVPFEESGRRDQHSVMVKRVGEHVDLCNGLRLCVDRPAQSSAVVLVLYHPPDILGSILFV